MAFDLQLLLLQARGNCCPTQTVLVEKKLEKLEKLPEEFENCADGRDFHVLVL